MTHTEPPVTSQPPPPAISVAFLVPKTLLTLHPRLCAYFLEVRHVNASRAILYNEVWHKIWSQTFVDWVCKWLRGGGGQELLDSGNWSLGGKVGGSD